MSGTLVKVFSTTNPHILEEYSGHEATSIATAPPESNRRYTHSYKLQSQGLTKKQPWTLLGLEKNKFGTCHTIPQQQY